MEQQKQKYAATSVGLESTEKRKVTAGSVWDSNGYGSFEVVEYKGCEDVLVRFIDTGFECKTHSAAVRAGSVRDKFVPSVVGVGFIGSGKFPTSSGGKNNLAYISWRGMLTRCYSPHYHERCPSYMDCTVCDEWHNFQNFSEWFYENYPDDGESYQLDKDLKIIGNRVYSPNACMFVSSVVNSFTVCKKASRGRFIIGVSAIRGRFSSQCSNPFDATGEHLGSFDTEIEAHLEWRKRKSYLAYELAMIQDSDEVKQALLRWKCALDNFEIHKI